MHYITTLDDNAIEAGTKLINHAGRWVAAYSSPAIYAATYGLPAEQAEGDLVKYDGGWADMAELHRCVYCEDWIVPGEEMTTDRHGETVHADGVCLHESNRQLSADEFGAHHRFA